MPMRDVVRQEDASFKIILTYSEGNLLVRCLLSKTTPNMDLNQLNIDKASTLSYNTNGNANSTQQSR